MSLPATTDHRSFVPDGYPTMEDLGYAGTFSKLTKEDFFLAQPPTIQPIPSDFPEKYRSLPGCWSRVSNGPAVMSFEDILTLQSNWTYHFLRIWHYQGDHPKHATLGIFLTGTWGPPEKDHLAAITMLMSVRSGIGATLRKAAKPTRGSSVSVEERIRHLPDVLIGLTYTPRTEITKSSPLKAILSDVMFLTRSGTLCDICHPSPEHHFTRTCKPHHFPYFIFDAAGYISTEHECCTKGESSSEVMKVKSDERADDKQAQ